MRKVTYLINTFFVMLFSKSFVFANGLESEISHLVELGKSNISQANSLMSLLRLLTALFTLAFVTVLGFVIFKLIELAKQMKANKEELETIKEHGDRLATLAGETTEIRNQIRDQNLMAKGIKEEHYGNFLKEVLKMEATPSNMNMIRNLVWTLFKPDEYESGLKRLREIFGGGDVPTLKTMIKRIYAKAFNQSITQRKLLTWVYEIKEKKKKLEDLLSEERQSIIDYQKSMREFWKSLPPLYPEREPSGLEQIFRNLSKEEKSSE